MPKHILVAILLFFLFGSCRAATIADSDAVVDMLKNGFQIAKERLPDADECGAALVQTALERFADCPDAAAKIKIVYDSHVDKTDPIVRYTQWGLLLEYLDRSLNRCGDTASFQAVWKVRREIVEERQKAVMESVAKIGPALGSFVEKIGRVEKSGSRFIEEFKSVEPNSETKDTLDFLLKEIDVETNGMMTAKGEIDRLRGKAGAVAKLLDGKLASSIVQLNQRLDAEKKKDLATDGAESYSPKNDAGNVDAWETGPYQRIMEEIVRSLALREDVSVVYWFEFQTNGTTTEANASEKLGKIYDEARRLQVVRYNLWTVRRLAGNVSIDVLARIDTGLLVPSVAAIYAEKESELMKGDNPSQRSLRVRKLLLTQKIGLDAF